MHKVLIILVITGLSTSNLYIYAPLSDSAEINYPKSAEIKSIVGSGVDSENKHMRIRPNYHESFKNQYMTTIEVNHMDMDLEGNLWITGNIASSNIRFSGEDAFLSKVKPDGTIEWMKLFEGEDSDIGNSFSFDSQGDLIFATQTDSKNFEATNAESAHSEYISGMDIYVEKLTTQGETIWSGYYGGVGFECCTRVNIDENDNIYISGWSSSPNYPLKNSFLNESLNGGNLFLTKLSSDGEILWSTIFGGFLHDSLTYAKYGGNGMLTLAGWTNSPDYPTTNDALSSWNSSNDFAMLELNVSSKEVVWSSTYGGLGADVAYGFYFDTDGNLYIPGQVNSVLEPVNSLDETLNITDGYVLKLDTNHNILWNTYLGGSNEDIILNMIYLKENGPLFTGITRSDDFPTNGTFPIQGDFDIFLTLIDDDGTQILKSSTMGGSNYEQPKLYQFGTSSYLVASTESEYFTVDGVNVTGNYPFSFQGDRNALLFSIDQSNLNLSIISNLLVVPEPDSDYDTDGLTNWEEYRIYIDNGEAVDPLNPDSDSDQLPDGWELSFNLDPDDVTEPSTDIDSIDGDGLSNFDEYSFGTWPNDTDTDNDGMDDLYEYENGLFGTIDDANNDTDGDLMPNLYEYQHNFTASNQADGNEDPDGDNLVNSLEYSVGTDPLSNDTDGDGMLDGVEYLAGLDPLDGTDLSEDNDGDLLSNGFEVRNGLNPNSPIELVVIVAASLLVVAIFTSVSYGNRKRNKQARLEGYESFDHKKTVQEAGYNNLEEYEASKSRGFVNKDVEDKIGQVGVNSSDEFIITLERKLEYFNSIATVEDIEQFTSKIQEVNTPGKLLKIGGEIKKIKAHLSKSITEIKKYKSILVYILGQYNNNEEVLLGVNETELITLDTAFEQLESRLHRYHRRLETELDKKEQWLEPWNALLKLLQITEKNRRIFLDEITQVMSLPKTQAEELIMALLDENTQFGDYDPETKIYHKSENKQLEQYLQNSLKQMEQLMENVEF